MDSKLDIALPPGAHVKDKRQQIGPTIEAQLARQAAGKISFNAYDHHAMGGQAPIEKEQMQPLASKGAEDSALSAAHQADVPKPDQHVSRSGLNGAFDEVHTLFIVHSHIPTLSFASLFFFTLFLFFVSSLFSFFSLFSLLFLF